MLAMLPLANSDWLLAILGILVVMLLVVMFVVLYMQSVAERAYDDGDEEYVQYTNVRVLDKHPYDYNQLPRPYDYEVDG